MINLDPVEYGRKAGSLTWAGLYNTYYWMDPASGIAGVIMMQVLPFADERLSITIANSSSAYIVPSCVDELFDQFELRFCLVPTYLRRPRRGDLDFWVISAAENVAPARLGR